MLKLISPLLQHLQIITFFGGKVYINEGTGNEPSRLSFAGEYQGGDASLLISDLLLTDSGEYSCKVKTGGEHKWSQVNLIVLGEHSQTHCNTHTNTSRSHYLVTKRPKPIYKNTHRCRPNNWIISLAHFLCHAD